MIFGGYFLTISMNNYNPYANQNKLKYNHCVKSVRTRSLFQTRITPNTDTFYGVDITKLNKLESAVFIQNKQVWVGARRH